jgi:hypothetical protein
MRGISLLIEWPLRGRASRLFCSVVLATSIASASHAQTIAWERLVDGPNKVMNAFFGSDDGDGVLNKKALDVDAAGNSVMIGRVFTGANFDWLAVKYNASGTMVWRSQLNGQANGDDSAFAVTRTAAGDYIVAGQTVHTASTGAQRCTVAKFNGVSGTEMWRIAPFPPNVPSTTTPYASTQCLSLALDSSGDIYAVGRARVGTTDSANAGDTDAYILKLNAAGTIAWSKIYQGSYAGTGAAPRDNNAALVETFSNTAVYVGMRLNNGTSSDMDWGLRVLDESGTQTRALDDSGDAGANDRLRSIAVSSDGTRVALAGFMTLSGAIAGVAQVYNTANLSSVASLNFSGGNTGDSRLNHVSFDASNAAYFSGAWWLPASAVAPGQPVQMRLYANKVLANGSLAWQRTSSVSSGAGRYAESLMHTVDASGNMYAVGIVDTATPVPTTSTIGSQSANYFVVKFSAPNGTITDTREIDGPAGLIDGSVNARRDRAHAVAIGETGTLYVAGNMSEPVSNGNRLNFGLVKLDTSASGLNPVWSPLAFVRPVAVATSARLASLDTLLAKKAMKVDSLGNVYAASRVNNGSDSDILITKHDPGGNLLWSQQIDRLIGATATSGNDIPYALAIEPGDANIYVVGATQGVNNGETTPYKAIVLKYSAAGVQQWLNETIVSPTAGNTFAFDVVASAQAAYIVGVTDSVSDANGLTSTSNGQWLVAKVIGPAPADVLWRRSYASGNLEDRAFHVAIEPIVGGSPQLYNVFVGGRFNSGTDNADNSNNWVRIAKYVESSVNTLSSTLPVWTYSPANSGRDSIADMKLANNTVYFVGQKANSSTFPPTFDMFLGKITNLSAASPTGAGLAFSGDGTTGFADTAQALALDAAGNVYVAGLLNNASGQEGLAVVKVNSAFTEQWRKTLNPTTGNNFDTAYAITTTVDGPVVTGMLFDGTFFMGTVQLRASDGEVMWVVDQDTTSRDFGLAVQTVPSGVHAGRVVTAGWGGKTGKSNTLVLQAIDRAACTLKVDGRLGAPTAPSDGLIMLRAILGLDEPVVSAGTSPLNDIDTRDNLVSTLRLRGDYDVDLSGTTDFKDALVILRYLLGFNGNSVTDGLSLSGSRNQWLAPSPNVNNSIKTYLDACGTL